MATNTTGQPDRAPRSAAAGNDKPSVAVTGAAGFLGRYVVARVHDQGHAVRVILHTPRRAALFEPLQISVRYADIRDRQAMASALEGCDRLIHCAAIISERGADTYESVNVEGVRATYAAARDAGIRRAVQVSPIGASPRASASYLRSRGEGEEVARDSGVPMNVIQFSTLFGPGDAFLSVLAGLVRLGPFVPVAGSGKARFQPIHIEDAAESAVRLLHEPWSGEIVAAGGPNIVSYDQILDEVASALGRRIVKIHVPLALMRPSVRLMEALLPQPPITTNELGMLKLDNVVAPGAPRGNYASAPRPLAGNLDYLQRVRVLDGVRIMLGRMPAHIRDH